MKLIPYVFVSALVSFSSWSPAAELVVGQQAPRLQLSAEMGARVDGKPWDSQPEAGKLAVLFYIDPEEKKLNEPLEAQFKVEQFPKDQLASIAVINMAAAWYPNSMIASELEKKQKEFPHTVYVKDLKKVLVKDWGLKDDSVNVLLFDRDGKVLFVKKGAFSEGEIKEFMALIRSKIRT